jgi:hypothetical protein
MTHQKAFFFPRTRWANDSPGARSAGDRRKSGCISAASRSTGANPFRKLIPQFHVFLTLSSGFVINFLRDAPKMPLHGADLGDQRSYRSAAGIDPCMPLTKSEGFHGKSRSTNGTDHRVDCRASLGLRGKIPNMCPSLGLQCNPHAAMRFMGLRIICFTCYSR